VRRGKDSDLETLIDDDALETMIIDKLDSDPAFWENRKNRKTMITVEVDGGYAILNGIVKSQVERRKADILARALGALGVDNRLRLESEIQDAHS
jgi:osmotically-inducible protein OsmY